MDSKDSASSAAQKPYRQKQLHALTNLADTCEEYVNRARPVDEDKSYEYATKAFKFLKEIDNTKRLEEQPEAKRADPSESFPPGTDTSFFLPRRPTVNLPTAMRSTTITEHSCWLSPVADAVPDHDDPLPGLPATSITLSARSQSPVINR